MECPSNTSSWYWLVIIGLVLLNWWLFEKWQEKPLNASVAKDSEKLVPDFYDSELRSRGPNYVGDEKEDEVSKHRKRQKRREKLEKAREEREKRISSVTVTRSADGQVTTTVDPEGREGSKIPYAPSKMADAASRLSPPEEVSWEQDDIGLVPVEEDDETSEVI